MAGLSLALLLVVECGYRFYEHVRPASVASWTRAPDDDSSGTDWWPEFVAAREQNYRLANMRFDPFRGWWALPFRSRYLNVDERGRRATVHSPSLPETAACVDFFGGSAVWGFTVQDAGTIPSLLEAELARRGVLVRVVNFGQVSFTAAQGLASLTKELREGRCPAAVVCLDGVNEASILLRGLRPGDIHHQLDLQDRFTNKSMLRTLVDAAAHLHVLSGLRRVVIDPQPVPPSEIDACCNAVASQYGSCVDAVEALADRFHFAALMLWQPNLAMTGKRLTAAEERVSAEGEAMGDLVRRCTREVVSLMALHPRRSFTALVDCLDQQTTTMFTDHWGHLTLAGNRLVAAKIADMLEPVLRRVH